LRSKRENVSRRNSRRQLKLLSAKKRIKRPPKIKTNKIRKVRMLRLKLQSPSCKSQRSYLTTLWMIFSLRRSHNKPLALSLEEQVLASKPAPSPLWAPRRTTNLKEIL